MSTQADEHAYLSSLLANITERLRILEGGSPGKSTPESSSAPVLPSQAIALATFDEYLKATLHPFLESAAKLGGQAVELSEVVKDAWGAQREFLAMACCVKAPANDADIVAKLSPVQEIIQKAQKLIQRNDFENHAKSVAEGMQALTWVVVRPAPTEYIENFIGAADFWGNKVRVQHKKTAPEHVAFVDTYKRMIVDLAAYVKAQHVTGVTWNPQGRDIGDYAPGPSTSVESPAPSKTLAAATPAPSQPEAPAAPAASPVPPRSSADGRAGLFSQLGKGLAITSGLKKVSKEQQTWRPEYKESAQAGHAATPGTALPSAPIKHQPPPALKPPRSSYEPAQFRWNVEHFTEGTHSVEVEDKKQSVYIYGCGPATVEVRGKGKSLTVDSCRKTQVVVDELLSSLEVVNCKGVTIRVRQQVPTVAIDKTDGVLVVLPKSSLGASFLTSKSSEMNVQYPKNNDGELTEIPIPEQWQHSLEGDWPNLCVKNEVSSLYTH
jgi:adenylyl cyclase-associated protein